MCVVVSDKFDAWYQQNLPSDDETRHLIDPNQSDDSSMNLSFDLFAAAQARRSPANHSIISPSIATQQKIAAVPSAMSQQQLPCGDECKDLGSHCNGAFTSSISRRVAPGQGTVNTTSDLGNSYHSDSLSSDDCNTATSNGTTQGSQQTKHRQVSCR